MGFSLETTEVCETKITPRLGGEHGSETLFLIFPFLAFRTHVRVQTTILEMIAYLPTFGLNLRKSVGKYSIHEAFEFYLPMCCQVDD